MCLTTFCLYALIPQLKSLSLIPEVILAAKLKIFDGIFLNNIESNLTFFPARN